MPIKKKANSEEGSDLMEKKRNERQHKMQEWEKKKKKKRERKRKRDTWNVKRVENEKKREINRQSKERGE